MECPVCKSETLARSRFRWYESWRRWFWAVQPYRCVRCERRFWFPTESAHA